MASDGFALLLAGHTHGGQVRVPFYGALTTNCDLPHSMARGLHRWPNSDAWLHVSAGLGTHPTAPVRFACRPEATVLTLIPR
jgi:predicted MPP superfamily phosphohydrolase